MGLVEGKGWWKEERGRKNNFTPGVSTPGKSMYYHNYIRYSCCERGAIHHRDEQASKKANKTNKQTKGFIITGALLFHSPSSLHSLLEYGTCTMPYNALDAKGGGKLQHRIGKLINSYPSLSSVHSPALCACVRVRAEQLEITWEGATIR